MTRKYETEPAITLIPNDTMDKVWELLGIDIADIEIGSLHIGGGDKYETMVCYTRLKR